MADLNGNGNGSSGLSRITVPIAALLSGLGAVVWALLTLGRGELDTLRASVERHHLEPGHAVVIGRMEAQEREFAAVRERIESSEKLNEQVHREFVRRLENLELSRAMRDADWEKLAARLAGIDHKPCRPGAADGDGR